MTSFATVLDAVLEGPVIPSFTSIGYSARRKTFGWRDLDDYDLAGRTVAITGPTSGLGKAAALQLAKIGANLILIARNPGKIDSLQAEIAEVAPGSRTQAVIADMGSLDDVRRAAEEVNEVNEQLDVLIHNAGSLFNDRRTTTDGTELTVRVHVESPFLLTGLLSDTLAKSDSGRVLTMSSGGMYTSGLTVDSLEMKADSYKGSEQYARAKRAQVTLNEMWADRIGELRFHSLHPGWADTPGVEESLPTFRKVVGPLLRTPSQGADTLVWLAADDGDPLATTGLFWHDRRPRPLHKVGRTRRTDTPERRQRLWDRVSDATGFVLERVG